MYILFFFIKYYVIFINIDIDYNIKYSCKVIIFLIIFEELNKQILYIFYVYQENNLFIMIEY